MKEFKEYSELTYSEHLQNLIEIENWKVAGRGYNPCVYSYCVPAETGYNVVEVSFPAGSYEEAMDKARAFEVHGYKIAGDVVMRQPFKW